MDHAPGLAGRDLLAGAPQELESHRPVDLLALDPPAAAQADQRVADLPGAWRDKYRTYLGIAPPHDADGVLQDVHWSSGAIGYFPTYSLGNLYAAQLFEQAASELGDVHTMFRRGDFLPLRDWLQKNIFAQGRRYPPAELARRVTGQALSHAALMRHLRGKFSPLYGLN